MTPIDTPAAAPRRKKKILLVAAVAALLLIALAVTLVVVGGGHKVRYEVESSTGSAFMISWENGTDGLSKVPESLDDRAETPFSTTVTVEGSDKRVAVAVDLESGIATCRIFVDGKKVSEATANEGVMCEATTP